MSDLLIQDLIQSNRALQATANQSVMLLSNIARTIEEVKLSVRSVDKKLDATNLKLDSLDEHVFELKAKLEVQESERKIAGNLNEK
jgi:hypothetical protein